MKKLKLDIQRFSSTNKTTNYDLPQFVGTDKPTWLGDVNEAMASIDAGMHKNASDISTMASDVASASATASQASQDVSALTSTVNTLSGNVSAVTTTANNAQQTATSALNTANTANGKADTNASGISTINTNIGDLTNLSTTDKTSLVNAINEIESQEIGITGHILWTNPNPTSSFSQQTITLSSDDYDELTIFYKKSNNENKLNSIQIIKGYDTDLSYNDSGTLFSRGVTHVSDTSYKFNDGKILLPGSSTAQNDNSRCVPIYVIGYKTGLFS